MKCQDCGKGKKDHGCTKEDLWCPEFNKHLCSDCYTEFRWHLRDMFDLDSFEEACDLLEHINIIKWHKEREV